MLSSIRLQEATDGHRGNVRGSFELKLNPVMAGHSLVKKISELKFRHLGIDHLTIDQGEFTEEFLIDGGDLIG